MRNQNKLAVAFGGGSVRGFMHIGVIKALEELSITPSIVTGTSAGSIAAACLAAQIPATELYTLVDSLKIKDVFDFTLNKRGFIKGNKLTSLIDQLVNYKKIQELPIKLGITATDLNKEEQNLITTGSVGTAVRASCSLPGLFIPVKKGGKTYIDGGVLSAIPVKNAYDLGADVVIAVDIYCSNRPKIKNNILAVLLGNYRMQVSTLTRDDLDKASMVIAIDYEPTSSFSFKERMQMVEAGYQATLKLAPELKKISLS